ncbi:MAG: hypothetical protein KDK41_13270 [Leptospiraceae bacterium]|nr:hypothetical protein [Leptospiraceae bacterium]MCB1201610.1 hypothetical protein [Leptospiraceae bacterium]
MRKIKITMIVLMAAGMLAVNCKKKQADQTTSTPAVQLTGTPAQQMTQVMGMGLSAIKSAATPADAAAALQKILSDYNVAALRQAAKDAKAAGQGATAEEIAQYKALADEYKKLSVELGGKDPAAFAGAAEAWAKAWGIN